MRPNIGKIISGGQSGADRAALSAAVKHKIPYGGYCPKGGWAEDMTVPPGIRKEYPLLRETESTDPSERTVLNVLSSDATLIFFYGNSPGTKLTLDECRRRNRPVFLFDEEMSTSSVEKWLESLGPNPVLNIAGPRESENPGIYEKVSQVLDSLLE